MTQRFLSRHVIFAFAYCFLTSVVVGDDSPPIDYARDVEPIFVKNCVACHNAKKPEGGLNLESHQTLLLGGDSGESIVAKDIDGSYLLSRVTGAEEPLMPPEDNSVGAKRLSESEIATIQKWIQAGATASDTKPMSEINWQPLPINLQPVYAIAASEDGQHLAFGRGNTVSVTSQAGQTLEPNQNDFVHLLAPGPSSEPTHRDIVQSIAFSPDSQRIATGGYRNLKIWRKTTEAKEVLVGLAPGDGLALISPDGTRIARCYGPAGLELVDVASGQSHLFLRAHTSRITAMVWLDASAKLLSCAEGGEWILTDAATNRSQVLKTSAPAYSTSLVQVGTNQIVGLGTDQKVFELRLVSDDHSTSLSFRPLDQEQGVTAISACGVGRLAMALVDGTVLVTQLDTGEVIHQFKTDGQVQTLELNQDATLALTVSQDSPAKLWHIAEARLIADLTRDYRSLQKVKSASRDVARQRSTVERLEKRLPELQKVADSEVEARRKVQETRDKAADSLAAQVKAVEQATLVVTDAEKALSDAQAAVEAAQKQVETILAGLEAKKTAVEDATKKQRTAEEELSKRDQALAAAADSADRAAKEVPKFETRIAEEQQLLQSLQESLSNLNSNANVTSMPADVEFSTNSMQVIVSSPDRIVRLFSSSDGSPLASFGAPDGLLEMKANEREELLALTTTGTVLTWDLGMSWHLEHTIGDAENSPFSDRITALDFSPDGRLLAIGSGPPSRFGEIQILDVVTGAIARNLGEVHSDTVFGLRFSPDGRQLASAGADRLCRLFDVANGQMIRAFEGHSHHVLAVAWRDDGQTLATASADASIKIWTVESGEQVRTITGFSKDVTAIQFIGQTNQIISTSTDGTARLHNTDDGKQMRMFSGTNDPLYGLAIWADEKRMSAGGQSGKVWTWQVEDAKLLESIPANQP